MRDEEVETENVDYSRHVLRKEERKRSSQNKKGKTELEDASFPPANGRD